MTAFANDPWKVERDFWRKGQALWEGVGDGVCLGDVQDNTGISPGAKLDDSRGLGSATDCINRKMTGGVRNGSEICGGMCPGAQVAGLSYNIWGLPGRLR